MFYIMVKVLFYHFHFIITPASLSLSTHFSILSKRHRNAIASGSRCGPGKPGHRSRGTRNAGEEYFSRRVLISPLRLGTPALATSDGRNGRPPAPKFCHFAQLCRFGCNTTKTTTMMRPRRKTTMPISTEKWKRCS